MMISRRPNTRASTENAPGPSPMMATSIVKPKISAILVSKRFGEQAGSTENPTPTAPAATSNATTGVRKPIRSRAPATKAKAPMNHVAGAESDPPM